MSGKGTLYGGTDMSEAALERDIVADMTSEAGGWIEGSPKAYDRGRAIDTEQLQAFLEKTQPQVAAAFELSNPRSETRALFLNRVQGHITKHGVVDLLRKGLSHSTSAGSFEVVFYGATPSPGNAVAEERHRANRWSVTRQLRYSQDETQRALDLAIFVNGLPLATFELKNHQTKQTVEDAVEQYKNTRDHRNEPLFHDGRCLAHFAVDEHSVRFCTRLAGKKSWFLPFDKGWNGGAGNPPNPEGYKTAYLWQDILSPASLADIIEHYAARLVEKDPKTKREKRRQIFPRYHQLDVVRRLLADSEENGAGQRYLIQHSAGSGKSNSIAWLAHQLVGLGTDDSPAFDAVIVVTDRINLDRQIERTVKAFTQVRSLVKHADKSKDLREALANGTKIVISTVQKFPVILQDIGDTHRDRKFAIIIDEAHSGQGGKTTHAMSGALGAAAEDAEEETTEDKINKIIDSQKLLANASYYAFTATPKPRTLGYFGREGADGRKHPFHVYTMQQAIEEGFILDVLKNYTTVESYYKLVKSVEDDPEFDAKKAAKKLRRYVEGHSHAIETKASIMVDHLLDNVIRSRKIGGKARAMVVADGIPRALAYYSAINAYLKKLGSPYRAIVAFSGEHEYGGQNVTEPSLNGFPSNAIETTFREDPYRILVCADKFQTGYDEPLLHTMYVDKPLSGVRAVQTLSRLNRAHPEKHDVAVLDFYNKADGIQQSFAKWYRTTTLADAVDPNTLHDLRAVLDGAGVYDREDIDQFVEMFLAKEPRSRLEAFLDQLVVSYQELDSEEQQVEFKGTAKAFVRTYDYLAGILPYRNPEWLKLSIMLTFLIPKLPAPIEEDLSRGILETVDLDSYRAEQQAAISITLGEEDAELTTTAPTAVGHRGEPELKPASIILEEFNQLFGNIPWTDKDRIRHLIAVEIPAKVREDKDYINAQRYNDEQNARVESDAAVQRAIATFLKSDTELYRQFAGNPAFKRWLTETVFRETYDPTPAESAIPSKSSGDSES